MLYLIDDFSIDLLSKWRVIESESRTRLLFKVLYDPIDWLAKAEHIQGNLISVIVNEKLALKISEILRREIAVVRNKNIEFKQEDDILVAKQIGTQINWISINIEY
jgi:hypothetical protein